MPRSVTVTILDEAGQDHWTRGLPDDVMQEEAEMFVWARGSSTLEPASRSSITEDPKPGYIPG